MAVDLVNFTIPGVEIFEGVKPGSVVVIHDNFVYNVSNASKVVISLKCRKNTCASTALIYLLEDKEGCFSLSKDHTHPKDSQYIKGILFRRELRDESKLNPFHTPKKIYNDVCSRFGESILTFRSVESLISRSIHRKKGIVSLPIKSNVTVNTIEMTEVLSEHDEETSNNSHNNFNKCDSNLKVNGSNDSSYCMIELKNCSIPGVNVIEGHRSGTTIITHDNFVYLIKNKKRDIFYLKCRDKCSGTAIIYLNEKGEGILKKMRPHNHQPDTEVIRNLAFRTDLRAMSRNNPGTSNKVLLQQVSSKHFEDKSNTNLKRYDGIISRARKKEKLDNFKSETNKQNKSSNIGVEEAPLLINNVECIDSKCEIKLNDSVKDENESLMSKEDGIFKEDRQNESSILSNKVPCSTSSIYRRNFHTEYDTSEEAKHLISDKGDYIRKFSIPDVEQLEGLRLGSLVLVHKNYAYLTKMRKKRIANLKCRCDSCAATAVLILKSKFKGEFKTLKCHTHPPDIAFINKLKFRKELRLETSSNPKLTAKEIYRNVVKKFRRDKIECKVAFPSVVGLISRSRLSVESTSQKVKEDSSDHFTDTDENIKYKLKESNKCITELLQEPSSSVELDLPESDKINIEHCLKSLKVENSNDDSNCLGEEVSIADCLSKPPLPKIQKGKGKLSELRLEILHRKIPGVTLLDGFRLGGLTIVYNNHTYLLSIPRKYTLYLRCRLKNCRATAKIKMIGKDEGTFIEGTAHSHPPEMNVINTLKFRHELREESLKYPTLSPKEIFNRVSSRGFESDCKFSFSSVGTLMSRSRKLIRPPDVDNLKELGSLLKQPDWSGHGMSYHTPKSQPWFRGAHSAQDGTEIAVFINELIRQTIPKYNPVILHIDTSYRIDNEVFVDHHMLTFHVVFEEKVFAFAFFILSKKSSVAYNKCFDILEEYTGQLEPALILTDYEPMLLVAIRVSWPLTTTRGCYYHFVQAIMSKCQEINKDILGNRKKRDIVKGYLTLPLLPPEHILLGQFLIAEVINKDNNMIDSFWLLNDYITQFWIEKVGIQSFNVYKKNNKTNDFVELFYQRLKHCVGSRKNLWDFIDALRVFSHNEEADYLCCLEGGKYKMPNKKIIHLQQNRGLSDATKVLSKNLQSISKLPLEKKEEIIKTLITTFIDSASKALDGLVEREIQEPKQCKITRPKRVLVANDESHVDNLDETSTYLVQSQLIKQESLEQLHISKPEVNLEDDTTNKIMRVQCIEENVLNEALSEQIVESHIINVDNLVDASDLSVKYQEVTNENLLHVSSHPNISNEIIRYITDAGIVLDGENSIIEVEKDKFGVPLLNLLDHDYSFEMIVENSD